MELKDALAGRRSVRKYKDKKIPLNEIAEILEYARLAPSAGNTQNWRFIIVTDANKKKKIAEASLSQHWMTTAPMLLVVCNNYSRLKELYGDNGRMFSIQNCAAIASHIMLLAKEKGLDTCWVGCFEPGALQKILDIPEHIDPEIVLCIGYSDEAKLGSHMRNEVEDMLFFEEWGNKVYEEKKPSLKERLKKAVKK